MTPGSSADVTNSFDFNADDDFQFDRQRVLDGLNNSDEMNGETR
jgi:hypothetical protein